jgi:hypothetical protein
MRIFVSRDLSQSVIEKVLTSAWLFQLRRERHGQGPVTY